MTCASVMSQPTWSPIHVIRLDVLDKATLNHPYKKHAPEDLEQDLNKTPEALISMCPL